MEKEKQNEQNLCIICHFLSHKMEVRCSPDCELQQNVYLSLPYRSDAKTAGEFSMAFQEEGNFPTCWPSNTHGGRLTS